MSTFLSTHTIGRAFIISKKKKKTKKKTKDMFELSFSSIRQSYGSKPKYIKSICTRALQCSRGISGNQHYRYSLVMLVLRM